MTPSVYACITTRDGAIRNDVMACFMQAVTHAQQVGIRVGAGRQQFNHGTAVCRNKAVADFLAHTDATHLLFIDDDVLLPVESIAQLAGSAADPGVAVVCGAYPTFKLESDAAYLYLTARPVGGSWLRDWPAGLVEVDAGGTGCMAIRRDVFAAVGFPWFRWPEQHDPAAGTVQWVSDDVDFCAAARAKGFRVWCDGRVRPGHLKLTDLKTLMNGTLQWKGSAPPADADAGWGSHAGLLRMLGKVLPVRKVVEYGAGKYSTPLFLDKTAFPFLERLYSYESSPEWAEMVSEANPDPRLTLLSCPLNYMHQHNVPAADLVFVDCDEVRDGRHDFSARVKLLERYQTDPHAVVVVHDANFADIAPAVRASAFKHKATYVPASGPHTAVLSNAVDVGKLLKGTK